MKILILWRGLPHPLHPSFSRPFYFIKYYGSANSITLLSPLSSSHTNYAAIVGAQAKYDGIVEEPVKDGLSKAMLSLLRRLTYTNLRYAKDFNVFKQYLPSLQRKVNEILKEEEFDIIYSDYWACSYLYPLKLRNKIKTPVILEFFSPTLYSQRCFLKHGSSQERVRALLTYLSFRFLEVERYRLFEAGIYVSRTHLELSKPFLPKRCYIIPPGIDLDFFKPLDACPSEPIIAFVGSMNYTPNILGVLHFYSKIFPYIKREFPTIRFYIIGRNPDKRVKKLCCDPSIIVTGTVDDIRPYTSMAQVFVNPITVDDGGVKNKVLEAMAMGKAIVSTPLGVRDIGVTDGKNVVIAKSDKEFAEKVVELLKDENERRRIGRNARKFVEENYSWERQSKTLYDVFRELAEGAR
jgi:glycosyltransferase involved in cell wall biosynthesis